MDAINWKTVVFVPKHKIEYFKRVTWQIYDKFFKFFFLTFKKLILLALYLHFSFKKIILIFFWKMVKTLERSESFYVNIHFKAFKFSCRFQKITKFYIFIVTMNISAKSPRLQGKFADFRPMSQTGSFSQIRLQVMCIGFHRTETIWKNIAAL